MNFTPVPLLLGIATILGAVALFFLDRFKPGYGRDSDKVYSILLLISGVILLSEWTMPLLSSLQQSIMVGVMTSLIIQNINSRTPIQNRPMPQGNNWDGYGGGYRPSRPSQPAYGGDGRTNLRAELDRRDFGPPQDPYNRPRPMLGGREEPGMTNRPPYPQDEYSGRYDGPPPLGPMGGPMDRPGGGPMDGGERREVAPYSGGAPRPDERLRRRRPKTRSDYQDRYRMDGGNPPRDYRPDRDRPTDGWG